MFDTRMIDRWEAPFDQGGPEPVTVVGAVADLPAGLDAMTPGLFLAAILSSLDPDELEGRDRVLVLRAYQRLISHFQAGLFAALVAVGEAEAEVAGQLGFPEAPEGWDQVREMTASEVRAALTLTRRAADVLVDLAGSFAGHPRVLEALSSGEIDLPRARIILDTVRGLQPDHADAVITEVLSGAGSLTTGRLRVRLDRVLVRTDPERAKHRYEQALEERRVILERGPDGTADLHALNLPILEATRIWERLNRAAHRLNAREERRTIDQLRADVLTDLLLTGEAGADPKRAAGSVEIRVELTTLLGLDDSPGDISGWGPVIADIARRAADPDAPWRFVITRDGLPSIITTTRRRPNADQTRLAGTLNPSCVFPGCRIPARQCDLDHTQTWAATRTTSTGGLAPLCRHDHNLRHHAGWSYRGTGPGSHTWTSPLGHTYTTRPEPP